MAIITNKQEIVKGIENSLLRDDALDIVESGIGAVLPNTVMNAVQFFPSYGTLAVNGDVVYHKGDAKGGRIFVIGGGKAFGSMAKRLEEIVGPDNITDGVGTDTEGCTSLKKIRVVKASHPTPDYAGMAGVKWMMSLKQEHGIGRDDLVLFLVSGGGSSLMPYPVEGVSLQDKIAMTTLLIKTYGIGPTNTVRKHLSRIKGGQLGKYFDPTPVVTLALSDVIGNDRSVIASGPTYPDPSTFPEAVEILQASSKGRVLWKETPESVKQYLLRGKGGEKDAPETPKALPNCQHYFILGENGTALEAMRSRAVDLNYIPRVISTPLSGDPGQAAQGLAKDFLGGKFSDCDAIIAGGETSVSLPKGHKGIGGRNQHFALAFLEAMAPYEGDWVAACAGTDGMDYTTGYAGALVDHNSMENVRQRGLPIKESLAGYDSHPFLKDLGRSLIMTGPTGTNVCDVVVFLRPT
ncbi:DUF4147 domain-containing protein [Candidatus Woesearchaeota archaeon]|nr:DUF4147 domain-containing protein [Candidatus Woesearchaeota archaeon]